MSVVLHGFAAGGGIAIGRAHLVVRGMEEVPQLDLAPEEIDAEAERFDANRIGRVYFSASDASDRRYAFPRAN